ncbi:probable LRR receptor-like serine/threonine-protein kinase isoform X1, partial [Tanacetum coccineum]
MTTTSYRLLKSQNISATLPSEFSKLRYLKVFRIPSEWKLFLATWATMQLRQPEHRRKIDFRIHTQDLGNMKNLQKLVLASNSFTGPLPDALEKLTKLTDMRISDNDFTGKIPNFISKWAQIEK